MSVSDNLPMSSGPAQNPFAQVPAAQVTESGRVAASPLDELLDRLGDRLNPILVKEARQALKSRQFTVTFSLLLIGAWILSIVGVAYIGSSIHYGAYGASMFSFYFIALAFPLLVIVPFGAFRSLASEQEDRTFELLSITTLRPRQIVGGKLGSAMLQTMLYLSAISPCLGFTYLLRGIDLPTILFIVFYTLLASAGLSLIGLFFGTLFRQRHWQIVGTVALIAGLSWMLFVAVMMVFGLLQTGQSLFVEEGFWEVNGVILTVYASFFALIYVATATQLTFASDNRSTALRITMLALPILLAGWVGWAIAKYPDFRRPELFSVWIVMLGIYWYGMGAVLTGESANLPLRVRRGLPQTMLGRIALSWFNPGPATGYMFSVSNLVAGITLLVIVFFVGLASYPGYWNSSNRAESILYTAILVSSYVVFYLGTGKWLAARIRRFGFGFGVPATVLLHVCLVALGTGVPLTVLMMSQMIAPTPGGFDYSVLQATNPFWTLSEAAGTAPAPPFFISLSLVPLAAMVAVLINLPGVAREIRQLRIPKPARVAEEDALLHPQPEPPKPTPTGPWG